MCNCIEDFNKVIREKSGDPEGGIKVSYVINTETGKLSGSASMYCQYRDKKKDGTFTKPHDHPIGGNFCPFCGKNYDDNKEAPIAN